MTAILEKRKMWVDGKLVPFGNARVHIMSHSFCRGSAVFEVMSLHRTDKGPAVFRLDEHMARLERSAELVRMKLPCSRAAIKRAIRETVLANKVGSGMIKLICYYGAVEFEVIPRDPTVSMAVVALDTSRDLKAERFDRAARTPASVTVSTLRKIDPATMPIEAKSAAGYLGPMIAKMDAVKQGFSVPIMLDVKGYLAEGATESLFLVKNNVLKTPAPENVLAGITRKTVIELAKDIGIDVVEKNMRPAELKQADEVFLTSSIVKVWPANRVENKRLPAPGQVTRILDKALEKICAGKVKSYKKWLTVIK